MEGSSSSDSWQSWAKDGFTDLLLSWSLEEILDEDLYKCQVEKIPDSFEGVDQYLDAYIIPLLEEVHSELVSAMEAVDEAPFCEIKSVTEFKHGELMYDVEVDYWINRVRGGGKPYTTLPGDFVLLSDSQPCDMQCAGWTCNFASVIRNSEGESGDSCTTSSFQLKIAHSVEVGDIKSKPLYMVYLMNMTPLKRIWSALKMRRNLNIIEKVLTKNDLGEEICEFCHLKSEVEVEESLGSTLVSKLNESQMKAILASISKIECKHKFSVQLLWGPPGTGKTTTLSILLYILLRMNVRTVVCAPSNTAVITSLRCVLFSESFKSSLKKLKSSTVKKLALALLLNVANGWRPRNINVDRTFENSLYVVKQFKVCDYYVVCSIDVIKDSVYKQVLEVWDILPMAETSKLWKRLESIFCMYTDDYVNRCQEKLLEGNLEVPKTWSLCCDIIQYKDSVDSKFNTSAIDCRSNVENSDVSESMLLMKFYSLTTGGANYLFSDLEGREVDLPFEVIDEQRRIILFPRSSFVLGRSGTGKTTILTMKLFQKYQLHCIASGASTTAGSNVDISDEVDDDHYLDEKPKGTTLHQLFVTVSPKLCYAVKSHVSQLLSFARGDFSGSVNTTGLDDIEEMDDFKDIPDTFVGIPQEMYPLIITFQKFLMMLDGALGNSFFQRFHDVRDSCQYKTRSVALQTFMRKNEVTYDRFSSFLNEKLKKDLDASRVYTEIMSHIKGGLQHREACDIKQCREDYISLSDSRASTLNSERRKIIYNIFENYEKMKLERGEFDLADLVMDIHHRLKRGHLLGDKMDFAYIDEVQDLTMRQILLFRYICNNVDEGFVFSGDTAQTVARGIDFRFEDIRFLFYNEFLMKSRKCDVSGSREKGLVSDIYCLSQNFRTHTGVLKLAQSVIDLICYYFPNSIDSLAPERSRVYGVPPVVLRPGCNENSIISIFGQSAEGCLKMVGFDADQVILVWDDSARKEIFSNIGNQALVLTFVECKGLEFL